MQAVDRLMRAAVAQGVFPGAVQLVGRAGRLLFHEAYGLANLLTRAPMERETVFDLASLTKPLATTLAVMDLIARGRLRLEDRLGALLPELRRGEKGAITIAQLLAHRSGLPAYRPYFLDFDPRQAAGSRAALRALIAAEPLCAPPGEATLYSDLGFVLLAWALETVARERLDALLARRIYRPIDLQGLRFSSAGTPLRDPRVAATEICPWRGRLVCGEVHDENAWLAGGVDGQAGLFGSAGEIFRLLTVLMEDHARRRSRQTLFPGALIERFWRARPEWRPLGFDAPAAAGSSSGRHFSPGSLGHLGFTGTSFWIDLQRELTVILLSNRVHPHRGNLSIRAFRPRLHDAVMKSVATAAAFF
jgi:CubicO group peptidase (beta-lactamase class C family)